MASEASRSAPSPDSYIGSLISLTSKSEIRYEGILYNINTEESSIGLRNVRSFGTEGRKKDGPQVSASDKIYEYILFRGSDIKDLQVKASPPVQNTPAYNDPAIIQSHYPRPPPTSSSLSSTFPLGSGSAPDLSSHATQVGLQRPTFQGSLPHYPTGGNLGSWGPAPPPPTANGSGLAMPMYWQGYYPPSVGLAPLQQPSLMRPLPGLSMPPMQATMQFQGMNTSLSSPAPTYPEFPPLFPPAVEMPQSSTANKVSATSLLSATPSKSFQLDTPTTLNMESVASLPQNIPSAASSKLKVGPNLSLVNQAEAESIPSSDGSFSLNKPQNITSMPALSQSVEMTPKLVNIKPVEDNSKLMSPEPLAPEQEAKTKPAAVGKEPILPLPIPAYNKPIEANLVTHESSRGRGRGRGRGRSGGYPRPVANFTEEFDFSAMNEKFNKDEVWGDLGKSRAHSSNRDGEEDDEADGYEEDNGQTPKSNIKPFYVKDDFFDSLSSNASVQTSNGRIRFSEQLKIDTETFGDFPRHRSIYGGGRGPRGGRGRGSYQGRGHGYYTGRGRNHPATSRPS
ncbi:Decapping 5-like protein [Apostasia shenzhenica]|uniref:Decapping 5-like protein n=1 Tax=Apostasia shenzhenica TaxID=1088818 RepID=A0A2I0AIW8_9ASPA|nr:Decapping 5-like protein [Apostasia shenzhenica]